MGTAVILPNLHATYHHPIHFAQQPGNLTGVYSSPGPRVGSWFPITFYYYDCFISVSLPNSTLNQSQAPLCSNRLVPSWAPSRWASESKCGAFVQKLKAVAISHTGCADDAHGCRVNTGYHFKDEDDRQEMEMQLNKETQRQSSPHTLTKVHLFWDFFICRPINHIHF